MEAYEEQLARVKLMAAGDDTWDLSPNDCAALKAVVARVKALETALQRIADRTEYGDAVVREVGLSTAPDVARTALEATPDE